MNSTLKSLLFWMVLIVVGVLIWQFSTQFQRAENARRILEASGLRFMIAAKRNARRRSSKVSARQGA